jgi:DNA-binding CsgD family transcriptional regulator
LLSPRERDVLEHALSGASVARIASALAVSEATVRSHLASIYAKLGVSGRLELLASIKAPRSDQPAVEPRVDGPPAMADSPASSGRLANRPRRSVNLRDPTTLLKIAVFAVAAVALGFGAGLFVIGAFGVVMPFRYPEDDDTLRERIPVALAYLTWLGTSIAVFVGAIRLTLLGPER